MERPSRAAWPHSLTGKCCVGGKRAPVCCQPLNIVCLGVHAPSLAFPPTLPRSPDRCISSPRHHPTGGKEDFFMASASAMPRAAHASRASGPHILYHSLGKELCRNGYQPCRLRKEGKPGPSGGTRKGLKEEVLLDGPQGCEGFRQWRWGVEVPSKTELTEKQRDRGPKMTQPG